MMVKGAFEQFRVFGVVGYLFLFSSCATAQPPISSTSVEFKGQKFDLRAELSSLDVIPGTILFVRVNVPDDLRKEKIFGEFEGLEFPIFSANSSDSSEFEGILGVPYDRVPGPGVIKINFGKGAGAPQLEKKFNIVPGDYRSEALRVDGRKVNPTRKKDLIRIKREQEEVALIYQKVTERKYWKGPFRFPIESKITSPFGTRRTYNGEPRNFHPGLDLKALVGTPILSAAPGVVVLSKNLFFTGNTVMIDHGYGVVTLYAHMSKLKVKKGQVVGDHELLGLSGMTGRVNGPHLHWQAVVHKVKVNPLGLVQIIK